MRKKTGDNETKVLTTGLLAPPINRDAQIISGKCTDRRERGRTTVDL